MRKPPVNFSLLIDGGMATEYQTTLYEFIEDNTSEGVDITVQELESVMNLKPGQSVCIGMSRIEHPVCVLVDEQLNPQYV